MHFPAADQDSPSRVQGVGGESERSTSDSGDSEEEQGVSDRFKVRGGLQKGGNLAILVGSPLEGEGEGGGQDEDRLSRNSGVDVGAGGGGGRGGKLGPLPPLA